MDLIKAMHDIAALNHKQKPSCYVHNFHFFNLSNQTWLAVTRYLSLI